MQEGPEPEPEQQLRSIPTVHVSGANHHLVDEQHDDGTINVRQAARVLDALGADVRAREDVKQVRAMAEIEDRLAKTLAALGLDHFITVAPRGPGGILENHEANREETP